MHVYEPPTKIEKKDLEGLNIQIGKSCPLGRSTASDSSGTISPIKFLYVNCKSFESAIFEPWRIITGRKGSGKSSFVKAIELGCYYDYKIIEPHKNFMLWAMNSSKSILDYPFDNLVDEIENRYWFLVFQYIAFNIDPSCNKINEYLNFVKKNGIKFFWRSWLIENKGSKNIFLNIFHSLSSLFSENYESDFEELFKKAKKEAADILKGKKVVILIDNPEEIRFDDEVEEKFFSAMGYAASTFQPGGEFIIVPKYFVSTEHYVKLKSTSRNWAKIQQRILALRWKPDELLLMLAKRLLFFEFYQDKSVDILDFGCLNSNKRILEVIYKYTDKKVLNKVRNIEEDTAQYLIRHTLLTPRQMIDQANSVWRIPLEKTNILFASSHDVRVGVSNNERQNASTAFEAYRDIYPYAEEICSEMLSEKEQFIGYSDFKKLHNTLPKIDKYKEYIDNPNLFLRMFIETGCLGIIIMKYIQKGDPYLLSRFERDVRDKLDVGGDDILVIHPMFIQRVGACISPLT